MDKPNLFRFATSELSQDAVLCWLVAWARADHALAEPALHRLANRFVAQCFAKLGRDAPASITSLKVQRQVDKIDVLATINEAYWLLIEDKAGTQEHSDQLKRYRTKLISQGKAADRIVPVYVQTGEQSSYASIVADNFCVVPRTELLELLEEAVAAGSVNAILLDFRDHLAELEQQFQAYRHLPVAGHWPDRAWRGFFSEVQQQLGQGDWDRVVIAANGFQGFWWCWQRDAQSQKYLQLEYHRLCFKLSDFDGNVTDKLAHARSWNSRLAEAARAHAATNLQIVKPSRHKTGRTMTAAVVVGDYRVAGPDGLVDMARTTERLKNAEAILHYALKTTA